MMSHTPIRWTAFLIGVLTAAAVAEPGATQPVAARWGEPVFLDDSDAVARELAAKASDVDSAKRHAPRRVLKASAAGIAVPGSPTDFQQAWHTPPVCQQLTGNCWAYASTSFLESEIHRLSGRSIKLSEMHAVYWEYVDKARRFVQKRGESEFPRGSQPNATLHILRRYGAVPGEAYDGLTGGRTIHADRRMYRELQEYLASVAKRQDWNEPVVVASVRAVLDKYMGRPPDEITVEGVKMIPREYVTRVLKLRLDDYVCIISCMQQPWYEWCEYQVPDNWGRLSEYFNVPLADFTRIVRDAAADGRTVCLGLDHTEPGFMPAEDVAFIPSFDLPSAAIDDAARQVRFTNESTTDDHIVHLVGVRPPPAPGSATSPPRPGASDFWYLIKDSDTWPLNGHHGGYLFFHEDYIRLKTLCLMLHRDTAERTLGRPIR